jgi:GxxExxY protein
MYIINISAVQTIAMEAYKYKEITEKIIGSAFKVHNTLGNGFQEVIYQRCMQVEMEKQGLGFARELEQTIYYEGVDVGTRRVDFLVESVVLVELKAVSALDNVHLAQGINYLEAFNLEVGLLLNFGSTKLEFRRLINSKKDRR